MLQRFFVHCQAFLWVATKNGHKQIFGFKPIHFCEQFPRPGDGFFFEIIAKRPVAQHLEHGVMISVVANFVQVVMLARHPQAFLRIGNARIFCRSIAQKNIFKLVHASIGEHQRGIVLDNHGCRGHNLMLPLGKKF